MASNQSDSQLPVDAPRRASKSALPHAFQTPNTTLFSSPNIRSPTYNARLTDNANLSSRQLSRPPLRIINIPHLLLRPRLLPRCKITRPRCRIPLHLDCIVTTRPRVLREILRQRVQLSRQFLLRFQLGDRGRGVLCQVGEDDWVACGLASFLKEDEDQSRDEGEDDHAADDAACDCPDVARFL
jgi:hypothetical protein